MRKVRVARWVGRVRLEALGRDPRKELLRLPASGTKGFGVWVLKLLNHWSFPIPKNFPVEYSHEVSDEGQLRTGGHLTTKGL